MKFAKPVLAASFGLLAIVAANAHADALADIQKSGVLKIAVPQDFAPFGSVNSDLQLQGLDIDVAKLIAQKMGVKVQLVPVASANRIAYLQTHKADLVISTLGKNAEREKVIDFSQAYAPYNKQRVRRGQRQGRQRRRPGRQNRGRGPRHLPGHPTD
ncbi:MAG: Cyclohexadienyl dehydratase [Herbaspirillum frisingense]|uniref:Cyclohexadienyl dehydratase n=1 Tax=Herbaspirillum frisingense TaxID=92645 RepID=A0A7V8G029_9BURK|nr:MAG: Cyclohexadienyl dehydratase [Herbaspirillum frisingense]